MKPHLGLLPWILGEVDSLLGSSQQQHHLGSHCKPLSFSFFFPHLFFFILFLVIYEAAFNFLHFSTLFWQEIYNTGWRKFAFLNVPPIGCMPLFRIQAVDGSCLSESLSYTKQHNEALFRALRKLNKPLPGFKYSLYDFYNPVQERIDHPSTYGRFHMCPFPFLPLFWLLPLQVNWVILLETW